MEKVVFLYISIRHTRKDFVTPYYRVEWHYYIKLKDDDLPLLLKVQKFFKCGNVYFQKERRANHKNCYRFEVSSYRDITNVIIPFFKKHQPKGPSRRNDFRIMCKIHKIVTNETRRHLTDVDIKRIKKLKTQMHV
jgi:hypothetical protein